MREDVLAEIIQLALSIDQKACKAYQKLADKEGQGELRIFWHRMSEEESAHVAYWNRLLKLAKSHALPPIFDRPYEIRDELKEIDQKIEALLAGSLSAHLPDKGFLLGFYLEFYLLHPAFEILFEYMNTLKQDSPEEDYGAHLDRFLDAMHRYGHVTPELELLSETIRRLWRENRELARQAHIDILTGVLNRRGLLQGITTLSHMAERTRQGVALLLIGIDHFKEINAERGHEGGDRALRAVVQCARGHIRASDLIGRYGGDEILVYLSAVAAGFVQAIAEKLRAAIEKENKGKLTVSIGVICAVIGRDVADQIEHMTRLASAALLRAKNAGRNCVIVDML